MVVLHTLTTVVIDRLLPVVDTPSSDLTTTSSLSTTLSTTSTATAAIQGLGAIVGLCATSKGSLQDTSQRQRVLSSVGTVRYNDPHSDSVKEGPTRVPLTQDTELKKVSATMKSLEEVVQIRLRQRGFDDTRKIDSMTAAAVTVTERVSSFDHSPAPIVRFRRDIKPPFWQPINNRVDMKKAISKAYGG